MSHSFNDSVVYIRNGKPIPAIVLSSLMSDRGELLTVLYAQPEIGPTLLAQGTTRGIAQVQQAVAPFVEGNTFGWQDLSKSSSDYLVEDIMPDLIKLSMTVAKIAPQMEISPTGTIISANTLLQECLLKTPESAPEQLDEAQGSVTPGDPESPHAIPGGVESDAPAHEIKTYSDGTVVSGPGPMPELSPAQQDAAELVQIKAAQNQPDA
jgi:hypothetical protein